MTSAGHNLYKIVKEKIEYEEIIVLAGPGNNGVMQFLQFKLKLMEKK